jgi:Predicted membrane protein (DUF2232)
MPLAAAIASGLVAALLYLSVLTGSLGALILVYLVQLPLFAAGLSLGAKAVMIAGGTATIVTIVSGGLLSGLLFFLAEALPPMLLVAQALRWHEVDHAVGPATDRSAETASGPGTFENIAWYPLGRLVLWLVGLGVVALVLAAIMLTGGAEGFRGAMRGFLAGQLGDLLGTSPGAASRSDAMIEALTAFFPAMAVASWLVMTAINGVLAQGALARFGLNRRPSPDIAALTLPRWPSFVLAGALLIAAVGPGDLGYLGSNLVPLLAIAYVFAGLAVLHAVLRRHAGRIFILIPAYATLLLGWPVLLVAACGMIDQWFGLRQRFAAAVPRQGE